MTPKLTALALLALLSLAGPLIEAGATGRVEPFSKFGLAEALLSLPLIYWWYHVDKQQRNYQAGPLMNAGVVALTILALPVYFIRSRGWKRGATATALAALVLVITFPLAELGYQIRAALHPATPRTLGPYKYRRHPLYSSLLFLAWGVFLKHPSLLGLFLVLIASFCLLLTAKIDESECLQHFGDAYQTYMRGTKKFIPFLF